LAIMIPPRKPRIRFEPIGQIIPAFNHIPEI
jgi:hypothetical protein